MADVAQQGQHLAGVDRSFAQLRNEAGQRRVHGLLFLAQGCFHRSAARRLHGRGEGGIGAFNRRHQAAQPDQKMRLGIAGLTAERLFPAEIGDAVQRIRQAVKADIGEVIGYQHIVQNQVGPIADAGDDVA